MFKYIRMTLAVRPKTGRESGLPNIKLKKASLPGITAFYTGHGNILKFYKPWL
jgi:hypothetical protein